MTDEHWNGVTKSASLRSSIKRALTDVATRLQAARRESLAEVAVPSDDQTWEYAGREWSWPAGEDLTYFRELSPKERSILRRASENHGLERIGTGTGRIVVMLPERVGDEPLVAKLARYGVSVEMGAGRPQNQRELSVWRSVGEHPFLPVLDAEEKGNWLIMPEADVLGERDPTLESATAANREQDPETAAALASVRGAMTPYSDYIHPDEIKPENVGTFHDRHWLLDYGRPPGEALFVDQVAPSDGRD